MQLDTGSDISAISLLHHENEFKCLQTAKQI